MPDAFDVFNEATELAELGQLDEALALFQTLIRTDPNNATIWNNIGIILFRQEKYRDAVNAFGQATDIDPHFTNAWFNKSLALVHLGKDTEALRALDKVLTLNQRDKNNRAQERCKQQQNGENQWRNPRPGKDNAGIKEEGYIHPKGDAGLSQFHKAT
jgi:tetratricopeptide (TPR) repeat protein